MCIGPFIHDQVLIPVKDDELFLFGEAGGVDEVFVAGDMEGEAPCTLAQECLCTSPQSEREVDFTEILQMSFGQAFLRLRLQIVMECAVVTLLFRKVCT